MTHQILINCLKPVIQAENQWRQRFVVTLSLGGGALFLFALTALAAIWGWWSTPLAAGIVAASLAVFAWAMLRVRNRQPDLMALARQVEKEHPDLNSALLTAMDIQPRPDGKLGYLQSEVLREVTTHAIRHRWVRQVSQQKLERFGSYQRIAVASFIFAIFALFYNAPRRGQLAAAPANDPITPKTPKTEIRVNVQPGNVEVEKGSRLIVEAAFEGRIPAGALLVMTDPKDGAEIGRLPMKAGIDETVFSAVIANVDRSLDYSVRFEEASSDRFAIAVYSHPDLERADVTVTPPSYSGLADQKIEDARKISVLEGSEVAWQIKVTKPVKFAELFGEDQSSLVLKPLPNDPTVLVASHVPKESQKYRLHLVDEKERANKLPPWFTVAVKQNLTPRLEFTFPRRDADVSAIQEFAVEASVWDDIGVERAGIVFEYGDEKKEVILAANGLPGNTKHSLVSQLAIEDLGASPRDLITYHLWAEDLDAEGKVRRTESDMFLAEIRHFEDIFRESAGQEGAQQGGQQGGQSGELLKLQKDILNASWRNLRTAQISPSFGEALREAVAVVAEAQEMNVEKTAAAIEKAEDPAVKSFFVEARQHMTSAAEQFRSDPLGIPALQAGQASARKAYESLIKARTREHNVTMSQSPSQGGQPQDRERQLMNLELKQKDIKYKENSAAKTEEETKQQQENLEVLNKLKELARRQEAIAEKIKELQTQLDEAKSGEEKEQIRRQLKRLQEEQDDLLRELDDLSQRMDSDENRANMAEERQKLEETRQNLRDSSKALQEQKLTDAANSATRAERDLKEAEDDFRKKTARQFSEEIQNIRNQARELADKQSEISRALDAQAPQDANSGNPFRSSEENSQLSQAIEQQRENLAELLSDLRKISEDSAVSEPLLSDALYDAVRESIVNGVENSLAEASRLVRRNHRNDARQPEQNAAQGIENLKNRIDKAAEKILGSEADSLRLARSELDRLIEQSRAEADRLEGKTPQDKNPLSEQGQNPGAGEEPQKNEPQLAEADRPNQGQPSGSKGKKGKGEGETPGQEQDGQMAQDGKAKGNGKGKGQGEGEGETPGQEQDGLVAQDGKAKGNGKGKGQGEGETPGQEQDGQMAQDGKAKGNGKGKGQGEGETPGQEQDGQMAQDGKAKGNGKGKGQMAQDGKGQGEGQNASSPQRGSLLARGPQNRRAAGSNFGGDDRGGQLPTGFASTPLFFDNPQAQDASQRGPITGEDYKDFANSLGNIEEMMPREDLRNNVAKVLDNARAMRIDYRRDNLPPQADHIRMKIVAPLVELRGRVSEELAKLNKENPIAPIDRDPVPGEFRELVRKYYEQLGSGGN